MSQTNQSFTEFKEKKRIAEAKIAGILNQLLEEFDVEITDINHETIHSNGCHRPIVYSVKIEVSI